MSNRDVVTAGLADVAHCVARGFVGSAAVISARLKAGCDTWAALSALKTDKMDRCNAGRAKRQRESKEEMQRLCAELDNRKAAKQ